MSERVTCRYIMHLKKRGGGSFIWRTITTDLYYGYCAQNIVHHLLKPLLKLNWLYRTIIIIKWEWVHSNKVSRLLLTMELEIYISNSILLTQDPQTFFQMHSIFITDLYPVQVLHTCSIVGILVPSGLLLKGTDDQFSKFHFGAMMPREIFNDHLLSRHPR